MPSRVGTETRNAAATRQPTAATCTVTDRWRKRTVSRRGELASRIAIERSDSRAGPRGMVMLASTCMRIGTGSMGSLLREIPGQAGGVDLLAAPGLADERVHVLVDAPAVDGVDDSLQVRPALHLHGGGRTAQSGQL